MLISTYQLKKCRDESLYRTDSAYRNKVFFICVDSVRDYFNWTDGADNLVLEVYDSPTEGAQPIEVLGEKEVLLANCHEESFERVTFEVNSMKTQIGKTPYIRIVDA